MARRTPFKALLATATSIAMLGGLAMFTVYAAAPEAPVSPLTKEAALIDSAGTVLGKVTAEEGVRGVVFKLEAKDMPPGPHSFHIHEKAACTPKEFISAGDHLNPDKVEHGYLSATGPHPGDLPNIHVAADGTVVAEVYSELVTLSGKKGKVNLLDQDGASFMIHENPDDYTTQPTGGGGARIACGELTAE